MDPVIFAPHSDEDFGKRVAQEAGYKLAELEERNFEDGEFKIRSLVNVRNRHCFVVGSLYQDKESSVNDKLIKLLYLIGSLKDASAGKVTAVVPYTAYARKDRKTKHRDPLSLKYLASLFKSVGTEHYVSMDVHNLQAYQNAFAISTDHLFARQIFIDYFKEVRGDSPVAVMSPDIGGVKRARALQEQLQQEIDEEVPLVFMEKKRSWEKVSGKTVVGPVKGRHVLIYDDMISSGTTLVEAAKAAKEKGALRVTATATHGVFSAKANEKLTSNALDSIAVTNTVQIHNIEDQSLKDKLTVLDCSAVFGDAIKRIVEGNSVEEMWPEL